MDERGRIAEAVRRKVCGPCGLSSDEARVLGAIVTRVADGAEVPPQEQFAAELGFKTREQLSRIVARLGRKHGFVWVQRNGPAPAVYHVSWDALEPWVEAEIRCAKNGLDVRPASIKRENGLDVRARGSSSSSSASSAPAAAAAVVSMEAEEAVRRDVDDAAKVVRSFGISVPFGLKASLAVWVRRGLTIDDFRETAELASKHARDGKFAYMEACLEDRWRGSTMGTSDDPAVVKLEDYRGLRPWVGA